MIVNEALMKTVSIDRLKELGFKEYNDGAESPFGYWWEITNEIYSVVVDPWYEIRLYQVNPDSDGIILFAEDEYELQNIIDFVTYNSPKPAKSGFELGVENAVMRSKIKRMAEVLQGVHDSFKDEKNFTGTNRQVDALNDVVELVKTFKTKTDEPNS
ncbi:MAG: hypothetical protein ACRCYO_13515 [Bacteroidia bacterium]